jgi:alanine-glyoxylate transaminase/serine-glyoxylate transaminase/serine-pyruvate transaminase
MGLSLLPPEGERLWTLNTVRVPAGVDEAAVRRTLLTTFNLEVGAGLGPLAGKIWRVGLMGASSTPQTLLQFLAALEAALAVHGFRARAGAGAAAAAESLRQVATV